MTELPQKLDAVYWQEQRRYEMAYLVELTGMTPEEIDADLSAPDPGRPTDPPAGTATFTPTPYGKILVTVTNRGYPGEWIIDHHALSRCIATALRRGYTIIDQMDAGA